MKIILYVFIAFQMSSSFCQPMKWELKNGGLKNATAWYIKKQKQIIDHANGSVSLNSFGIVMIDLYNQSDSLQFTDEDSLVTNVKTFRRCNFKISLSPRFYILKFPPSFYFLCDGELVAVYIGAEKYLNFSKNNISEFDKKYVSRERLQEHELRFEEYSIQLSDFLENGFKANRIM